MAIERNARCVWEGGLADGRGTVTFESSGAIRDLDVTWASRTEDPGGRTSPEELIAAAHAACFSMALSHALGQAGAPPQRLDVAATVGFQPGTGITGVELRVTASVAGMSEEDFAACVAEAEKGCPVSNALSVGIEVDASLSS